ncbi:MAG: DUF2911 domain-containing protein, partial [Acidobacteriota bacterium]
MTRRFSFVAALALALLASPVVAEDRPASPPGNASTQIGEAWIDVTYSRPILRGRNGIFTAGESYGEKVLGGAEYWRAGANATTKIKTDVALTVGDKTVPAGEYGVVITVPDIQSATPMTRRA